MFLCSSYHKREKEHFLITNKHVLNENHFREVEAQMQSFGISVIWFESFDEIPRLFGDIISPLKSLEDYSLVS